MGPEPSAYPVRSQPAVEELPEDFGQIAPRVRGKTSPINRARPKLRCRPSPASIRADREGKSDRVEQEEEIREDPSDPGGESCRIWLEFDAC